MKLYIGNAHEHNLKHINVDIPRNKLVVFTGLSGAGKSSLVFDVICKEAQRQYYESLPSFVRKYLLKIDRPKVDEISGLSPVVVINQKRLGLNIRSTVGTVTELYTLLRLLYSRCGLPTIGDSNLFSFNTVEGACPGCSGLGQKLQLIPSKLFDVEKSLNAGAILHSEYRIGGRRWSIIRASRMFDMDKKVNDFDSHELNKLLYSPRIDLKEDQGGFVQSFSFEGIFTGIMRRRRDKRGLSEKTLGGDSRFFEMLPCDECSGLRLNKEALSVKVSGKNIGEVSKMELIELLNFLGAVESPLSGSIVARMRLMLEQLIGVGVGYLHLDQPVNSLSGGEAQRVKMAKQLGSSLTQMIYVLDEPTAGLHAREVSNLIETLQQIRDKGNTVLVVEHDPSVITAADHIIDLGPGAGSGGGEITFNGNADSFLCSTSLTACMIRERDVVLKSRVRQPKSWLPVRSACVNNLKNVSVDVPVGNFVCVTGVSGSGKSTLISDVFCKMYSQVIVIDQSPVGRMNRGSVATYTDISGLIRSEFARVSGQPPGLFSYNSMGACPSCKGVGLRRIDMHFMPSVVLRCEGCQGKRFKEMALSYTYEGRSIHEVMQLTIDESLSVFKDTEIVKRLSILKQVGLGYLSLGQTLDTLSGGEAQRLKIASFLNKKGNVYVFDEPTTGLHMADVKVLLALLNRLVDSGNSVIVVEHNLSVIAQSDWVIDLGQEGGRNGGRVIFTGVVKDLVDCKRSYTGLYLKKAL